MENKRTFVCRGGNACGLPAGSRVTVDYVGKDLIVFTDELGREHSALRIHFDLYYEEETEW